MTLKNRIATFTLVTAALLGGTALAVPANAQTSATHPTIQAAIAPASEIEDLLTQIINDILNQLEDPIPLPDL